MMILFYFWFFGHEEWLSGVIPSSTFRNYLWWCSGNYSGHWGSNPGCLFFCKASALPTTLLLRSSKHHSKICFLNRKCSVIVFEFVKKMLIESFEIMQTPREKIEVCAKWCMHSFFKNKHIRAPDVVHCMPFLHAVDPSPI